MWRRLLITLALLGVVTILAAWVTTGASMGWSQTQVQVMREDELTGLEYPVWENRLVLGVDFLIGGLIGCGVLGGIGLVLPRSQPSRLPTHPSTPS